MKSLSLIVCLILMVGYLPPVQAVTDAELEALEKQIEQLESEEEVQTEAKEKKKTEIETKRKAEQKRKAEIETEKKRLVELEKKRLEEEQIRLEEDRRKLEEAQIAELERKRKEEENIVKKSLLASVILVVSGTYGVNCGAPHGNVSQHLADACNGRKRCEYIVDYKVIGDPVWGCGKTYEAEWKCSENGQVFRAKLSPEAGYRKTAILFCKNAPSK